MQLINFLTEKAYASASSELSNIDPTIKAFPGSTGQSVVFSIMSYVLNLIPVLLGGLAFFAILYSAILYLGAMGDPSKIETAKKNITWIAMGVVMVALTLIIIRVVFNIVGKASI